jgi:uncharacterized membrane protein YfcA
MDLILIFLLLALLAEILGTLGGFGSSLFFVPIASFFLEFHQVLGLTALFHLSSNISKIVLFRSGFDKKLVLNIGIPAVIFVIAGAWFSSYFNTRMLEIILGIFLLLTSAVFLIFNKINIRPVRVNSWIGGALSGAAAGLVGTGGAIRGLTLTAFSLDKQVFIATSALIDLGIDFSRSIVYAGKGYIHLNEIYLSIALFAVSFLGTYIGKILLDRFSQSQFRIMVLLLIFLVGMVTLVKQY